MHLAEYELAESYVRCASVFSGPIVGGDAWSVYADTAYTVLYVHYMYSMCVCICVL